MMTTELRRILLEAASRARSRRARAALDHDPAPGPAAARGFSTTWCSDDQEELYRLAVEQSERALAAAEARYATGAEDLLSVLDAQQTLLDADASLVAARQARLTASVDLVRALGGGWGPA